MKEFREFLRKRLCGRNSEVTQPYQIETVGRIANCRGFAIQDALAVENNAIELKQFET